MFNHLTELTRLALAGEKPVTFTGLTGVLILKEHFEGMPE